MIALVCVLCSSSSVVQAWPETGTYWRGSSQTGQSSRGAAYWTPHVTQIGRDTREQLSMSHPAPPWHLQR